MLGNLLFFLVRSKRHTNAKNISQYPLRNTLGLMSNQKTQHWP